MFGKGAFRARIGYYTAALAVVSAAAASPVRIGVVQGSSMYPALKNDQAYALDCKYYRSHPVRRGDVVVFRHDGITYVKRVLAVGGDELYAVSGRAETDDMLVMDWQLSRLRACAKVPQYSKYLQIVRRKIAPGSMYVVGDNLPDSVDSRTYGPVPTDCIIGRVLNAGAPQPALRHVAGNFHPESAS